MPKWRHKILGSPEKSYISSKASYIVLEYLKEFNHQAYVKITFYSLHVNRSTLIEKTGPEADWVAD